MIDWVHASVTVIESVTYFLRRKLSLGFVFFFFLYISMEFNRLCSDLYIYCLV